MKCGARREALVLLPARTFDKTYCGFSVACADQTERNFETLSSQPRKGKLEVPATPAHGDRTISRGDGFNPHNLLDGRSVCGETQPMISLRFQYPVVDENTQIMEEGDW
jgi:hypothetical protein